MKYLVWSAFLFISTSAFGVVNDQDYSVSSSISIVNGVQTTHITIHKPGQQPVTSVYHGPGNVVNGRFVPQNSQQNQKGNVFRNSAVGNSVGIGGNGGTLVTQNDRGNVSAKTVIRGKRESREQH